MDKFLRITLLLDFYGELLTEKQSTVVELYYLNDLSLSEIAEAWNVTPQSVRDLLRRTEKILEHYETKLSLMEKHLAHKQTYHELTTCMENLIKSLEEERCTKQNVGKFFLEKENPEELTGKEREYKGWKYLEAMEEMKTKLMELTEYE